MKFFSLNCGEYTFILRKEDVNFYNGYGIVKAKIDDECTLIGVVDKDYKIVLPLTSEEFVSNLFIAPNGNFIFEVYDKELNQCQVFHVGVNGSEVNLGANSFSIIDEEVVELHYGDWAALYDMQIGEFITPFYHYIGPFIYSDKYNTRVASVSFYIEDEIGNIINEVRTIISTRGEIMENYFDLAHGLEIESRDLTMVLDLVRRKS